MKRTRSIFALLAAVIMALVMVPAMAWGDSDSGDLEDSTKNTGTITIANPKDGETYTVYKIFDLASFNDSDPATGQHSDDPDQEAYSYVIKTDSTWLNFLTEKGPIGQTYKYARYSEANGSATSQAGEYFVIDSNTVTLNTGTNGAAETYYIVTPTAVFKNTVDPSHIIDDTGDNTQRTGTGTGQDADGNAVGIDYVTNPNSIVQDFAQEALKYATELVNGNPRINPEITLTSANSYQTTQSLGYYLVGTTMGTLASLDTTNKNVSIYEKNDEPAIEKKVLKKGSTIPAGTLDTGDINYLTGTGVAANDWVACTDADLEDYVQFRTVITAQQGAKGYILHDVMEKGFTFVSEDTTTSVKTDCYKNDAASPADVTAANAPKVYLVRGEGSTASVYEVKSTRTIASTVYTNWTLTQPGTNGDGCDFEIAFIDATKNGTTGVDTDDRVVFVTESGNDLTDASVDIKDGDKIVVLYWAKLNKDAVVFGDSETADTNSTIADNNGTIISDSACQTGKDSNTDRRNTNSTILTYGQGSHTTMAQAAVTTYQFDIVKTNEKDVNGGKELLAGAKFSIYKAVQNDTNGTYNDGTHKWNAEGNKLVFKKNVTDNEYYYSGDNVTSAGNNQDNLTTVDTLVSTATHEIHLEGLEDGTYIVIEDKAPTGYNKLSQPLFVTINGDDSTIATATSEGTITYSQKSNSNTTTDTDSNKAWDATITTGTPNYYVASNNGGIQIINQTGQELPSTGGLGTRGFVTIGGSLFAASVLFLYTKKRLARAA